MVLLLMMASAFAGVSGAPLEGFPVPDAMRGNVVAVERSTSMDEREGGFVKQAVLFAMQPDVKEGRKGRVVVMLRIPEKAKITLPVLYSPGLVGPAEITIPKGEKSVEFKVLAADDKLVNLLRDAWVEFVLGPDLRAKVVTVIHDDEKPPRLSIDRPTEITELGKNHRNARILLDRPADVDFPIRVECDPQGWFIAGEKVVRAGKTSVPVSIGVPADGNLTGDIPITMIVTGRENARELIPAKRPMMFIDQAKFELAMKLPASPLVEGQSATGMVAIQGRYHKPVTVALHCDHPELVEVDQTVTIPVGFTRVNFSMKARDTSVFAVDQKVTVTATTPGFSDGVATMTHRETRAIGHVQTMDLSAKDMVWDPVRKRIYASVPYYPLVEPGNWPFEASAVVAIDPETLEVTQAVNVLLPGQLILSKDGQSLYVAVGSQSIRRISLPDFSIQEAYDAGRSAEGSGRYIRDFCPLENHPGRVVLALWWETGSLRRSGFEVRDVNGAVSSVIIASDSTSAFCFIEPSGDPDVVCGITEKAMRKLRIGGDGSLTESAVVPMDYHFWSRTEPGSPHTWIRYDGEGAYCCGNGIVLDEKSLQPVRDYGRSLYDIVCPDTQGNRDYFLGKQGAPGILAYDRASASPLDGTAFFQEELKYGTHLQNSLIRWGSDGLAFSTDSKLILVNNQRLVAGDPPADLEVTLESDVDQAGKGTPVALTARVTNHGPNNATGAILNLRCAKGGLLTPVSSGDDTTVFGQQIFSSRLPEITAGSTWTTNVELTVSENHPVKCVAGIATDALDPDHTNNSAGKTVSVSFDPAESVRAMQLGAVDFAADPDGVHVWLAVPLDLDRQFANMMVAVNPKTGSFFRCLPLPWTPAGGTLAITGNGRYLLIGSAWGNQVHRFDLNALDGAPETIRMDSLRTLLALHPMDGNGNTLVVSGTSSTPYTEATTAVFDNGVMRPQVIYHFPHYNPVVPRFGDNRLIVFDAFAYSYSIDAGGLALVHRSDRSVAGFGLVANDKVAVSARGDVSDLETGTYLRRVGDGSDGVPLFDPSSGRFLMANHQGVGVWDPVSWSVIATLPIPVSYHTKMIRWGADGLALKNGSTVSFLNWPEGFAANTSAMRPAAAVTAQAADSDGDGTPDVMEALFGNSAFHPDACPLKIGVIEANGQKSIRLEFARRADMASPVYRYEWSDDLKNWTKPAHVDELVVSRFTKGAAEMEVIEAKIPLDGSASRFVRLAVP